MVFLILEFSLVLLLKYPENPINRGFNYIFALM